MVKTEKQLVIEDCVASSLLARIANADEAVRVTIAEVEKFIGQLPSERADFLRQTLHALKSSWASFLMKPLADRTVEEGKDLMQMTMKVMREGML